MEKMKCPFAENEEWDLYVVFDSMNIQEAQLKRVMRVLKYICTNKESKATDVIIKIIRANVTERGFCLLKKYYLEQFNEYTKTFSRLIFFKEAEEIGVIMQVFERIDEIYDALAECPLLFQ